MSQNERRLAAIMFTDIVGFTALGQEDESAALELLERHRQLVRPIFAKHSGREVKSMGDAFLVEFASALEASLCATDIQSTIHNRNLERGEKLQVRIGIHVGDVVHQGGDVLGDAVNVASRIEPLAEPGGICISEQVRDHVKNKISYPTIKLEARKLKNVVEPVEVYRVLLPWESEAPAEQVIEPDVSLRLAVLPFSNMSPDPADEFFADGLTEEMITELSGVQGLGVIARTSVMHYKHTEEGVKEIARSLAVGAVLEGSVRKAGNKIRITAQLISAKNEEHLWAERFDRELGDIFAVQSEIATSVAKALKLELLTKPAPAAQSMKGSDAYTLCLRARFLWNKRTKREIEEAILLFKEALRSDPDSARANAGLADCYWIAAAYGYMDRDDAEARAKEYVMQALALDDNLPEAHATLGGMLTYGKADLEAAQREFKKAISLNPSYAIAHQWYSRLLMDAGKFSEGLEEVQKAAELDPLSPTILGYLATGCYLDGRPEDAMIAINRLILIDPEYPSGYEIRAFLYGLRGMKEEAIRDLGNLYSITKDDYGYELGLASVEALLGNMSAAGEHMRKALPLLESARPEFAVSPYMYYAMTGDRDEFFKWADWGIERQQVSAMGLRYDPILLKMKDDSRFNGLLKKLGFPN